MFQGKKFETKIKIVFTLVTLLVNILPAPIVWAQETDLGASTESMQLQVESGQLPVLRLEQHVKLAPSSDEVAETQAELQPVATQTEIDSMLSSDQDVQEIMTTTGDNPDPYIRQEKTLSLKDDLNISEDSSTGALNFKYNIEIPKGRNNLQPTLQLAYNSQDTNNQSMFGFGWSMDIPYIQRLNIHGSEDLYSENNFYSSLSGKLLAINLSDGIHGTYGSETDNGDYLKYKYNTDGSWTVTDKLGTVYTFGTSASERQDNPADPSKIYKWMLEEMRDTNDNFIRYQYYKDAGQIYPYKIFYTGYQSTDGIFEVEFLRESRTDNATSTIQGFATRQDYRINEIKISFEGSWTRKYALSYDQANNEHRSVLDTIIEMSKDQNNNTVALPATYFDYQSERSGWTYDSGYDTYMDNPYAPYPGPYPVMGDFNSDGLVDLIICNSLFCRAHINSGDGTGWEVDINYVVPAIVSYNSMSVDLNGDGYADFLTRFNLDLKAFINNGDGTGWTANSNYDRYNIFDSNSTGMLPIGDFNGDSLPDFLWATDNLGIYINTGTGWNNLSGAYSIPNGVNASCYAVDVNGDSLSDFICQDNYDIEVYLNNGESTISWTFSNDYSFYIGNNNYYMPIGDFNGDSLPDFIHYNTSSNCGLYINKGDGTGWSQDPTNYSFPYYFGCGTLLADANADNLTGLFYKSNGTDLKVATNDGLNSDLLSKITYSKGSVVDIAYEVSTHEVTQSGELSNPNLPFSAQVVKQLDVDDGSGNHSLVDYNYSGGLQYYGDAFNKKFAGFAQVEKTIADTKTITYYHQGNESNSSQGEYQDSYYKIGKPYRQETYDNNTDELLNQTIYKWEETDLGHDNSFVYNTQKSTTNFTNSTKSTAVQYQYDLTSGNLLTENNLGEVVVDIGTGEITNQLTGDEKDTDYDYAENLEEHILAAPKTKVISDTSDSKQQNLYYDNLPLGEINKVNLTKEDYIEQDVEVNRNFNDLGLVTQEISPKNATTTIAYDSNNLYPVSITDPLNNVSYTEYNLLNGQVATSTAPNGLMTVNTFEAFGRISKVQISDPNNPSNLFTKQEIIYQDTNFPNYKETKDYFDTNSHATSREYYDGLDRVIQKKTQMPTLGEYSTVDISYDSQGRMSRQSLPYITSSIDYSTPNLSQPAKTYTYDALSRVLTETTPVGTTSYEYNGFTTKITDANGNFKELTKDAYGNLVEVKEYLGSNIYTTNYEYTLTNKLKKITDSAGNIRNFSYDALDNLEWQDMVHKPSVTTPAKIQYTYDKNGNVLTETSFKNDAISYVYDDLNRVLNEKLSGANKISYTYDQNGDIGQLTFADYGDGNYKSYDYDVLGRLKTATTTIYNEHFVLKYEYNLAGALSKVIYPNNYQVIYGFDTTGQVNSVSLDKGQGPGTIASNIQYNQNGQMTHLERANGVTTDYTYDPAQAFRLTRILSTTATSTLQDLNYTYDDLGNILTLVDNANTDLQKSAIYTYDDLNRLLTATVTYTNHPDKNYTQTFTYDSIGNMTTNSDLGTLNYANGQPHQLSSYGTRNFQYDTAGNMTRNGGITKFTWDWRNRLTNTHDIASANNTYYNYDHNNQRFIKWTEDYVYVDPEIEEELPSRNLPTESYIPEGDISSDLILEKDASLDGAGYWEWQVISKDEYIDKYFEKNLNEQTKSHVFLNDIKIATINNNDNPYYIVSDHLNSSSLLTTSSGTIAEVEDYKPYGTTNYQNTIQDVKDDYGFTGREYDEEINIQYFGARYLDNQLAKFTSIDPIAITHPGKYLADPQQFNTYSYARNNPLIYIDPLGLYNIKTGEIEKGDTQESITALINKTFGINSNWDTIANVSFYQTRLEGKPIDELVGKSLRIGTDVTVDITDQLNNLNTDRAKIASKFGPVSLVNFRDNGPWDIKSSKDNVLGLGEDGKRDYWSYIYNGELIRYDAPGNINYGYEARAAGLWGWQTQGVAAGEQIGSDISTGKTPSFADNAGDSKYVQMGINLFNSSRPWWQRLSW